MPDTDRRFETLSNRLLNFSFVQSWMSYLLLIVLSHILQVHLFALLSICYRINPPVDFCLDVLISLALHDVLNVVSWAIVDRYKEGLRRLFQPLFLSRPRPKLRALFLTGATCYGVAVVNAVGMNEWFISVCMLESLCCHLIRTFVVPSELRDRFLRQAEFCWFRVCPNTGWTVTPPSSPIQGHFEFTPSDSPPSYRPVDSAPTFRKRVRSGVSTMLRRARRKLM